MLELPPDQEERLRLKASETGQDAQTLLQDMVRQMLSASSSEPSPPSPRVAGLNRGQTWVSDDFDAPLPDRFWLGQPL